MAFNMKETMDDRKGLNNTHDNPEKRFTPLHNETRTAVPTDCAAFHLNREPQTLQLWSSKGSGPIKPIRINGRLAWPVADLRRVLEVQ